MKKLVIYGDPMAVEHLAYELDKRQYLDDVDSILLDDDVETVDGMYVDLQVQLDLWRKFKRRVVTYSNHLHNALNSRGSLDDQRYAFEWVERALTRLLGGYK